MKIKTLLPLLAPGANEAKIKKSEFAVYQRILFIAQKACMQMLLSKDIDAARLAGIYVEQDCIQINIVPKQGHNFNLNIYILQFFSFWAANKSTLIEVQIKNDDLEEEILRVIKEALESQVYSLRKGFTAEEFVLQIMQDMVKQKDILRVQKAEELQDISGADITFRDRDWEGKVVDIPLQVKTSKGGQEKHRGKHSHIPSIVVYSETSDKEEVRKRIRDIARAFGKKHQTVLHL